MSKAVIIVVMRVLVVERVRLRPVWLPLLWVLMLLSIPTQLRAQGNPRWLQQISSVPDGYAGTAPVYGISILEDGIVAAGWGSEIVISDSVALSLDDALQSFVMRLDGDGRPVWVERGDYFSDHYGGWAFATVPDKDGTILVTEGVPPQTDAGLFTWGGVVVNRYGSLGQKETEFSLPESTASSPNPPAFIKGLSIDSMGRIYLVGEFVDTLTTGGETFVAEGADVFLASVERDGNLRWLEQIRGPGYDLCSINHEAIFTSNAGGDLYIGCPWSEGTVFGEGQPNEFVLDRDATAIAKYDGEGLLQWVRTDGDGMLKVTGNVDVRQMATDDAGNLFAGWFYRQVAGETMVVVGDSTLRSSGLAGVFVTKYTPAGSLAWVRQIASSARAPYGGETITSIATDGAGNVYVGGGFQGVLHLDDGEHFPGRDNDGFVVAYNPAGDQEWTRHVAGPGSEYVTLLRTDPEGNLLVAGEFEDTVQVGDVLLAPKGFRDTFLAYFASNTVLRSAGADVPTPDHNARGYAYPNPFNSVTTIILPSEPGLSSTALVYDVLGRRVASIAASRCEPGWCTYAWDASRLPSGLYYVATEGTGGREVLTVVLGR